MRGDFKSNLYFPDEYEKAFSGNNFSKLALFPEVSVKVLFLGKKKTVKKKLDGKNYFPMLFIP